MNRPIFQVQMLVIRQMKRTDINLSFTFVCVLPSSDLLNEEPRGRKDRKPDEKYDVKCLKLNNNHIQDASGLFEVAREIILLPECITWIDLSFNCLQKIDPV